MVRYVVGVPAAGDASGKPGAPTPIRTAVTGGPPLSTSRMFPATSRIVGPDSGLSSSSVWPSALTVGKPSMVTVPTSVPVVSECH